MKCVKRADLPPEDEADLKMEVTLLQEVRWNEVNHVVARSIEDGADGMGALNL